MVSGFIENICKEVADMGVKLITEYKFETSTASAFTLGMIPEIVTFDTALSYGIKIFQLLAFASTVALTIYTIYKKEKNSKKQTK